MHKKIWQEAKFYENITYVDLNTSSVCHDSHTYRFHIVFFKWTYTSTCKRIALNCKTATDLNCIIIYIANFFHFWWVAGSFSSSLSWV